MFTTHISPISANRTAPLTGKVALVTGGSRSIGAAIAKRLAADGATVALTYSASPGKAADIIREIEAAGGHGLAVAADAGNPEAVRDAVATVVKQYGTVDILVNNAGIMIPGEIGDVSFADYQRMIDVNITGVFVATQEALRHMKAGGRVITIGSSMNSYTGFPGASIYTLTKGAVTAFTRGLVRELGARGITINTVAPGPTDTDLNPAHGPHAAVLGPSMAIGRYGRPEEVAGAVAYLASPEAAFITGAELLADGGRNA